MILATTGAEVIRDGWDWFAYGLTLFTFFIGLITFVAWLDKIRRRPELRFVWSHGTGPDAMQEWEPDVVLDVQPEQQLYVSAAFQNVGDATADHIIINFLVPQPFGLQHAENPKRRRIQPSRNRAVGETSEDLRVHYYYYYYGSPQPVTPGNFYLATFIVDVPNPSARTIRRGSWLRPVRQRSTGRANAPTGPASDLPRRSHPPRARSGPASHNTSGEGPKPFPRTTCAAQSAHGSRYARSESSRPPRMRANQRRSRTAHSGHPYWTTRLRPPLGAPARCV